ncbi:hypothetical protein SNEBB_008256, partial [Seison nebaliae]
MAIKEDSELRHSTVRRIADDNAKEK